MNTKTKVILAFITIFLVGVASGYFLNNAVSVSDRNVNVENYERDRRGFSGDRQRGRMENGMRQQARERLSERLELDQNQEEVFFEKMENYRSGLRDNMRGVRQREVEMFREYYHDFRDDLTDLLSEEQLRHLDVVMHPDSVRTRGFGRRGSL